MTPLSFEGCGYGDRAAWCVEFLQGKDCSMTSHPEYIKEKCCETCARNSNLTEEASSCKDKAKFCGSLFPGSCYFATDRDTCCQRCRDVTTGTAGSCLCKITLWYRIDSSGKIMIVLKFATFLTCATYETFYTPHLTLLGSI